MPETPDLSPMGQEAVAAHEMFRAFLEGGFTEVQAIRLVGSIIVERGIRLQEQQGGEGSSS